MDHDRRIFGYTLLGLSALLIVVGIGLTVYQFVIIAGTPAPEFPGRELNLSPTGVSARTTYVGLILIAIGAVLALASSLAFRRRNSN
jgi:hypothetical protein